MRRLGYAVTCCYGSAAASRIQFGAFAAVLADDLSDVSTAGNPLRRAVEVLRSRELVDAGLTAGALASPGGVWSWSGPVPMSDGLADAARAGIGPLGTPAREALEPVAHAEEFGLDLLATLAAPTAIDDLEAGRRDPRQRSAVSRGFRRG